MHIQGTFTYSVIIKALNNINLNYLNVKKRGRKGERNYDKTVK
jgi:hypothetical protein